MTRIFISYSRQDQLFARRLASDLAALGADLWLDVDDIPAGMNWSSAIQQGLDSAEAMIVVISPYSMSSKNVEDEWQYYLDHNKPIVPVYLTTGRMHFQLSRLQYIDFRTSPYETALKELHHELRRLGLKMNPFTTENLSNGDSFLDPKQTSASGKPVTAIKAAQPATRRQLPPHLTLIVLGILLLIGGVFLGARLVGNQSSPTSTVPIVVQPTTIVLLVTATSLPPTISASATATIPPTDLPSSVPTAAATAAPTEAATAAPLEAGSTRTDAAGSRQVWIPAGCFKMGSDRTLDPNTEQDENPPHEVCLTKGYWLDQYEVSNADYQKFIDAGGYKNQQYWSAAGWKWLGGMAANAVLPVNFSGFSDPQQPRVGITWYEAEAYARWRGGRLPTEAEWEYAARGQADLAYAWGNTWDPAKLNSKSGGIGKSSAVNGFPSDKNWVGAFNMTGNVREWNANWYDPNYYQQQIKDDPPGPGSGIWRVTRGGAWTVVVDPAATLSDTLIAAKVQSRLAYRSFLLPNVSFNTVGVRLVSDATP